MLAYEKAVKISKVVERLEALQEEKKRLIEKLEDLMEEKVIPTKRYRFNKKLSHALKKAWERKSAAERKEWSRAAAKGRLNGHLVA